MGGLLTDSKRIAVLGGRGMLGTALVPALRRAGFEPLVYDLPDFDIRRESDVAGVVGSVSCVVNCAACTNVEGAEAERVLATQVNAEAVGLLGSVAARRGAYVLHLSTDFVFDGTQARPYGECDLPAPLNVYGETKLAGERALLATGCRHVIVRLEWAYGRGGQNFVTKCLTRARETGRLRVVADQVGAPTWTRDAAAALTELLVLRPSGIFHYAAQGAASRFEVAAFIVREAGVACELESCRSEDFPSAVRRPLNSRFCCDKVDAVLSGPRPAWDDSLRRYLAELGSDCPSRGSA